MLPLRTAIRSKASTEVIDALIRAAPEVVKQFGVSGKTCLHLACLYSMDFDLFHELLTLWPDATKWKDRDGWHPLHLACLCHCPSTIASTVLNAYPEAAAIADSVELQYPLHIAALHGANATLLQRLYRSYPDAIRARTKTHGWLPLHLACSHKDATPGAIRVLLEYYPEAAKVSWLLFCSYCFSLLSTCASISLLALSHLSSLDISTSQVGGKICGSLPLHLATRNGCDSEILTMLFEAYPEALDKKNSLGDTPWQSLDVSRIHIFV